MNRTHIALLVMVLPAWAYGGGGASFQGLGDLPGGPNVSQVTAISGDGTVVVGRSATDQIGFETVYEAYRWTQAGGMVGMGDLDGGVARSSAYAVSTDGTFIVGTTETGGFRWQMSTGMLPLTDPPGELADMSPLGVSADGSVILGFGPSPSGGNVAARWTAATGIESLGALPNSLGFPDAYLVSCSADGTAATGNSFGDFVQPTRWTQQGGLVGLGDVPGGEMYGLGEGISADGTTVVGNARHTVDFLPRDEAFLWRESTGFFLLDPMNAAEFWSNARACSADGSVVVGYYEGAASGAMIWHAQTGMLSIKEILETEFGLDLTGWLLGTAIDVSDDGTVIVGQGTNPAGDSEAWIAHIPSLPGTVVPTMSQGGLLLLSLALLAAACIVLARRQAQRVTHV